MARQWWARESVGLLISIQLADASGAAVDLTGWEFECSFARQAGAIDLTLGMAANASLTGFYLTDPENGTYQVRILPAALQAIDDTTGDFTMMGDILATPGGSDRIFIEDVRFQVTEGVTV
jgi:hypothetical protein